MKPEDYGIGTREIKFRTWEKINKEMYHDLESYEFATKLFGERAAERFIIMQYTGLKDKNGKEIYEGDIIGNWKIQDGFIPYIKPVGKLLVYFFQDGWWVTDGTKDIDYSYDFTLGYDFEVIGNIFETPELLTQDK